MTAPCASPTKPADAAALCCFAFATDARTRAKSQLTYRHATDARRNLLFHFRFTNRSTRLRKINTKRQTKCQTLLQITHTYHNRPTSSETAPFPPQSRRHSNKQYRTSHQKRVSKKKSNLYQLWHVFQFLHKPHRRQTSDAVITKTNRKMNQPYTASHAQDTRRGTRSTRSTVA